MKPGEKVKVRSDIELPRELERLKGKYVEVYHTFTDGSLEIYETRSVLSKKYFEEPEPDSPCTLTNSSHEKALVRVVENYTDEWGNRDFIQVLCSCGHIISEAEIKSK